MEIEYIQRFDPIWEDWHIQEKLGSGSFGNVWKIVNRRTGRIEAVKEILIPATEEIWHDALLEGMAPGAVQEYFEKVLQQTREETAIMKKLSGCDNIVRFHDEKVFDLTLHGRCGWAVYIRMEYLIPLKQILTGRCLHPEDIRQMGLDLCEALIWCGDLKIVHQDIKPDNIFYNPVSKKYKLGDFGISWDGGRDTAKNKGKPGTLSYMSPEVYRGGEGTYALDRYALGMLLYRLMNHFRTPFLPAYPLSFTPRERQTAMMTRLEGELPPLPCWKSSEGNSGFGLQVASGEQMLADALAGFALRCIHPDPERRFADAREMQQTLRML